MILVPSSSAEMDGCVAVLYHWVTSFYYVVQMGYPTSSQIGVCREVWFCVYTKTADPR
jgi:hypothetical protein